MILRSCSTALVKYCLSVFPVSFRTSSKQVMGTRRFKPSLWASGNIFLPIVRGIPRGLGVRIGCALTPVGTIPVKPSGTQSVVSHPIEAMADARVRARVAGPALSAIAIRGVTSTRMGYPFCFRHLSVSYLQASCHVPTECRN